KGRRAEHAEGAAFPHVRVDLLAELPRVEAGGEGLAVEGETARVPDEGLARELRAGEVQQVVVFPEHAAGRRAAGRFGGGAGAGMRGEGEVLEDEAHLAPVLLQELVQHGLRASAERTLEVAELDDGDGRAGGAAGERGIDGDRAGLGEAGERSSGHE